MKSAALVLGLALAANAQVDNELATSLPYHPSGADLVKNAGWGRHLPIHTPPKHTNPTYWSKNDDAADDELLVNLWSPSGADLANHRGRPDTDKHGRPYTDKYGNPLGRPVYRDDDEFMSLSGADLVKYAKQSQSTTYRPVAHVVRDDEADDELLVNLWSPSGADLANHRGRPDTDKHGRPYTDKYGNPLGRPVYRDDEADDEFATQSYNSYHPSGADLVKNAGWGRHLPIHTPPKHTNPTYWSKNDDVVDDELAYLGHLIKETQSEKVEKKPEIRRKLRPVEKN